MKPFPPHLFALAFCLCCLPPSAEAQGGKAAAATGYDDKGGLSAPGPDSLRRMQRRRLAVGMLDAGFTTGSFLLLNQAWYADYERGSFHLFNDWGEWFQMDKLGHLVSNYHGARISADTWRWAGLDRRKAAVLGVATSLGYQTMVELLDGFSEKWGFSTGDMAMNLAGAGLFLAQEHAWRDQRIGVKISLFPVRYDPTYRQRATEIFGSGFGSRWLKDYNGQTYWLSANLRSMLPGSNIPRWLNVAVGHGARTMLGGRENIWTDAGGNVVDRSDVARYRRIFLSADVDLSRIPVRSRFLKSVLSFANILKIPAPALEIDGTGRLRLHALYY